MKFKFKPAWIIAAFISGYAVYVIILSILGLPNPVYKSEPHEIGYDSLLKPFDPIIPDSLSYAHYKSLKDSINDMRKLKNGEYYGGSGTRLGDILGTDDSKECDTCSLHWIKQTYEWKRNDQLSRNYLTLPSWTLNIQTDIGNFETDDSVQFYVEHKQAYVRKFVKLSYIPKNKYRNYHMIDEPVRFRYNAKANCVMIPVSKTVANVVSTVLLVVAIVYGLYYFLLISYFLWFLIDVSKGNTFTDVNMIRLKTIAYSLIAIPFISLLLNLLLRVMFMSYLTSDVVLKVDTLDGYWKMLAMGVAFLVIYLSFRQGKKLKDDQEFTV